MACSTTVVRPDLSSNTSLNCIRRDDNCPLLQFQVIQGDGGELSIPKYLTSNSDNSNGSGSISYSSNVFSKKVDMNNSPRLTSVGGSYHIIDLTNTPFNYVWPKEFGLKRLSD